MNYQKLFEMACSTINRCKEIEKSIGKCKRIPEDLEYNRLKEALTPAEQAVLTDFVGQVNGLRWQIKQNYVKFLEKIV